MIIDRINQFFRQFYLIDVKNQKVYREIEKTNKFALMGYDHKPKVSSTILRSTIRAIRDSEKQNEVYISPEGSKQLKVFHQQEEAFHNIDRRSFGVSEPKTPDLAPPLHYRERNRDLPSHEGFGQFDRAEEGFVENSNRSEPKSSTRKLETSHEQVGSGRDFIQLRSAGDEESKDYDVRDNEEVANSGKLTSSGKPRNQQPQIERFQDSHLSDDRKKSTKSKDQQEYLKLYEPLPPHSGLTASHEDVMIVQKGRSAKENFLLLLKERNTCFYDNRD